MTGPRLDLSSETGALRIFRVCGDCRLDVCDRPAALSAIAREPSRKVGGWGFSRMAAANSAVASSKCLS